MRWLLLLLLGEARKCGFSKKQLFDLCFFKESLFESVTKHLFFSRKHLFALKAVKVLFKSNAKHTLNVLSNDRCFFKLLS